MFPGVLINILIGLLVVGLILYLISLIPTKPETAWVSQAARVIVIVFAIIWLISLLAGWLPAGPFYQYPQHR
jgi:hypothetical protein